MDLILVLGVAPVCVVVQATRHGVLGIYLVWLASLQVASLIAFVIVIVDLDGWRRRPPVAYDHGQRAGILHLEFSARLALCVCDSKVSQVCARSSAEAELD